MWKKCVGLLLNWQYFILKWNQWNIALSYPAISCSVEFICPYKIMIDVFSSTQICHLNKSNCSNINSLAEKQMFVNCSSTKHGTLNLRLVEIAMFTGTKSHGNLILSYINPSAIWVLSATCNGPHSNAPYTGADWVLKTAVAKILKRPFLPFISSFFFVRNRPWAAQNQAALVAIAKTPQRPVRLWPYKKSTRW